MSQFAVIGSISLWIDTVIMRLLAVCSSRWD